MWFRGRATRSLDSRAAAVPVSPPAAFRAVDRLRDLEGQRFWSGCYAPFSSMYLDPHGDASACCLNSWHRLGSVTDAGLLDIWRGPAAAALREALAAGDLTHGCEGCAVHVRNGDGASAYLRVFDRLRPTSPEPSWPEQLEFALSNACNLQCEMCNGELSSAIRIHREHRPPLPEVYGESFFAELDEFLPHLGRATFLGGEPFLAAPSIRVMERLIELGCSPTCHVTTNGTQWRDRIRTIVESLPMHVAISVDGVTAATVEAIRVGTDHAEVLANIDRFRAATAKTGAGCSLAYCLMVDNWHEFGGLLEWADRRDLDVFVNEVDAPARFNLRALGDRALGDIVAALRHEGAGRADRLGRNRAVWDAQVRSLEAELDGRAGSEVAIALPTPVRTSTLTVLEVGPDQLIKHVEVPPTAGTGPSFSALVGRPLRDLQLVLVESFGSIARSELQHESDGTEVRTVTFEGPAGTTVLDLTMVASTAGETWAVRRRG